MPVRVGLPGDLVHAGLGGQSRPDVEELPDALLGRGQELHGTGEEPAILNGGRALLRKVGEDPVGCHAIRGEVIKPSEEVVIHPGDVRL